jgi:hypothetical protein
MIRLAGSRRSHHNPSERLIQAVDTSGNREVRETQSEGEGPEDQEGMTDVNPIISIPSHDPTLQDCLLAHMTGIIAGPCRKSRTAKPRPAMGTSLTLAD